jgi:hypothetical protein
LPVLFLILFCFYLFGITFSFQSLFFCFFLFFLSSCVIISLLLFITAARALQLGLQLSRRVFSRTRRYTFTLGFFQCWLKINLATKVTSKRVNTSIVMKFLCLPGAYGSAKVSYSGSQFHNIPRPCPKANMIFSILFRTSKYNSGRSQKS